MSSRNATSGPPTDQRDAKIVGAEVARSQLRPYSGSACGDDRVCGPIQEEPGTSRNRRVALSATRSVREFAKRIERLGTGVFQRSSVAFLGHRTLHDPNSSTSSSGQIQQGRFQKFATGFVKPLTWASDQLKALNGEERIHSAGRRKFWNWEIERVRYKESRRIEAVDVQLLAKLFEDAPPGMRTRMWIVFLENTFGWPTGDFKGPDIHPGGAAVADRDRMWARMHALSLPVEINQSLQKQYKTLTEISLGQEEVDETILRDIDRTFPEYLQFQDSSGQRALFRVLKAYSVSDLEVEYCQGMAFPAGLTLMFLQEEMAYKLFSFLMSASGCDMRSLYLPGLAGIQGKLSELESNLRTRHPRLSSHFEIHGVSAVLYASSWFLTVFASTFPVMFSARIIDIVIQERSLDILMRVAITILAAAEEDIIGLSDLEDIVNFIKLQPALWSHEKHRHTLSAAFTLKL